MMGKKEKSSRLLAIATTEVPNAAINSAGEQLGFEFKSSLSAKALNYAAAHRRLSPANRIVLMEEARNMEQFLRKIQDRVDQQRRRGLINLRIDLHKRIKKV